MERNRPTGRKKVVTDNSLGVHKRGEGQGTGPVGSGSRPTGGGGSGSDRGGDGGNRNAGPTRSGGGKSPLMLIIVLIVALLGGGGGLLGSGALTGGGTGASETVMESLAGNPTSASTSAWYTGANTSQMDNTVATGSRAKYTNLLGNGQDTVTIMIYLCGTDLESKSGMATRDLMEMTKANISDKVNVIVYTGGCARWQNQVLSTQTNQIYQVKSGGLQCLVQNAGSPAMTNPETLASFIQWCAKNFPANRNELIFWDHGGGSVTGYGYDEKNVRSGSMSLAGIDKALRAGGVTFDFIGFDACLMATVENGLMLDKYADYLIASEETEPGVGWYYTDWLTALSRNTSLPTLQLGKSIVDSFVETCATTCRGQLTTLSVVDLAELSNTVPAPLKAFSQSISGLINENSYKQVSTARNGTREFAQSTMIDQIDLVHFAQNLNNREALALADALTGAVKYNRTSNNMTNAYGLSVYFPYRKVNQVDAACATYKAIGMDSSYSQAIRDFAGLEVSGQAAAGGYSTALPSLLGQLYGSSGSYSGASYGDADVIGSLLGSFLSGGYGRVAGLDSGNTAFYSDRTLSPEDTAAYLADNTFDPTNLTWSETKSGDIVLKLPEKQWDLVADLNLNLFYDDGEGYVDLGLDNVFDWDDDGNLLAATDRTWLAINGQPVAYYHEHTAGEGDEAVITGTIPALLNGDRVDLLAEFSPDAPQGRITGARPVYDEDVTLTVAKSLTEIQDGDTLEFLCDYYTYDGDYQDSYLLGEPMTVSGDLVLSNVDVGEGKVLMTYRFTDIYQQHYWTESLVF